MRRPATAIREDLDEGEAVMPLAGLHSEKVAISPNPSVSGRKIGFPRLSRAASSTAVNLKLSDSRGAVRIALRDSYEDKVSGNCKNTRL